MRIYCKDLRRAEIFEVIDVHYDWNARRLEFTTVDLKRKYITLQSEYCSDVMATFLNNLAKTGYGRISDLPFDTLEVADKNPVHKSKFET